MTQPIPDPFEVDEQKANKPVYRYYVAHPLTHEIMLELPFTNVTWGRVIRRAGTFSGSVVVDQESDDLDLFWGTMPGRTLVYVTRYGKTVWGGMIDGRSYADGQLTVNASSFEAYLYRRYVWHTLAYDSTWDQYAVVRDLIEKMRTDFQGYDVTGNNVTRRPASADIGITVQAGSSGKSQARLLVDGRELTSFGDAIETFSNNINGFEYNIEIDWDPFNHEFIHELRFRDTPPSQMPEGQKYTGARTGLDTNFFEYPGNVLSISYDDSIEGAATRFYATGQAPDSGGSGDNAVSLTPRGVWNNKAYLDSSWPLLEFVDSSSQSETSSQTLLDAAARRYGQLVKPPVPTWSVTVNGNMDPQVGSYVPGDWCRLMVNDVFMRKQLELTNQTEFGVAKRIAEFSVTVPDTEHVPEQVSLTLVDEWQSEDSGGG